MIRTRILLVAIAAAALPACAAGPGPAPAAPTAGSAPQSPAPRAPRTFQAGAPGEASRVIDGIEAVVAGELGYTEADVRFLQGMIPHHSQALEMTALVPARAASDAVRQMALRMEISQRDEIALMESWLRERGEPTTMGGGMHAGHDMHAGHTMPMADAGHQMPGMLTPDQMAELRAANGAEFDRLFLEYMIQHHEGALVMVRELFASPGAGQESTIFKFAEDVDADQTMEIERMQRVLESLR